MSELIGLIQISIYRNSIIFFFEFGQPDPRLHDRRNNCASYSVDRLHNYCKHTLLLFQKPLLKRTSYHSHRDIILDLSTSLLYHLTIEAYEMSE